MPSDARVTQAREHHRHAGESIATAELHRRQRDALIRAIRDSDPGMWTYARLAAAVGCSPELVAAIVKGRV